MAVPQLGPYCKARLPALGGSALPGVEVTPPGTQPLPRVLELAASTVADLAAFDHSGTGAKQPVETMDGEHAVMD